MVPSFFQSEAQLHTSPPGTWIKRAAEWHVTYMKANIIVSSHKNGWMPLVFIFVVVQILTLSYPGGYFSFPIDKLEGSSAFSRHGHLTSLVAT